MKKILLLLLSFSALAQNPTSFTKIKVTGMTEKLTNTRNVVQDLTTKEFHFAPLSSGSSNPYKGLWNANLNTPTLVNGTGQTGDYYLVSFAGTALSYNFKPNDKVWYDGTIWRKDDFNNGLINTTTGNNTDTAIIVGNGITSSSVQSTGFYTGEYTLDKDNGYNFIQSGAGRSSKRGSFNFDGLTMKTSNTVDDVVSNYRNDNITNTATFQAPNTSVGTFTMPISIKGNTADTTGEINLDDKYIPLTGTITAQPITGDLEIINTDSEIVNIFSGDRKIEFDNADGNLSLFNNLTNLRVQPDGLRIISPNTSFGLNGQFDYSANYNSLSYVQKSYVDGLVSGAGATNLTYTPSAIYGVVNSDTGTDATIPLGNGTNAGLSLNDYTTAEKNKLASTPTSFFNGAYSSLTGIPSTFTPSAHSHVISDVTNLQTTIDAKVANDLTESTTIAPSKTAVNTALGLKQDIINENNIFYFTDFINSGINANPPFTGNAISSGTIATSTANLNTNRPGVVRLTSSTTANGGYRWLTDTSPIRIGGKEVFTCGIAPINLTTTTNYLGFHDAATNVLPVDGVYFKYANSGSVILETANNNSRTSSATITTIVANTWYKLKITINSNATSALGEVFDASGSLIGSATLTTNIPTGVGRETGVGITATESTTTATAMVDLDFILVSFRLVR